MDTEKVYIDKNYNIIKDGFICDSKMANTICLLNKKGYHTKACCSGHNERLSARIQENVEIELLDSTKEDKHYHIFDLTNKDFKIFTPRLFAQIYIMFDQDYSFPSIPKDFSYKNKTLEHIIFFYKDDVINEENALTDEEINNEIEKKNEILDNWAKELPERKDDIK